MDEAMATSIKDLTIVVDSQNFDSSKTTAVNEVLNKYIGGTGELRFEIVDKSQNYSVPLYSRSKKVKIERELVSVLEAIDGITVKVNGRIIDRGVEAQDELPEEEFISD